MAVTSRRASANAFLLAVLALGLAGSLFFNFRNLSEIRSLEAMIDDYALRERLLEEKARALHEALPPGPDWDKKASEAAPNPRETILEDLLSQRDLLPWEGVLGGTMKIQDPRDVWFLGPSWCMAYVEDGHIGGYMLLSYEMGKPKVSWKLLDAAPLE